LRALGSSPLGSKERIFHAPGPGRRRGHAAATQARKLIPWGPCRCRSGWCRFPPPGNGRMAMAEIAHVASWVIVLASPGNRTGRPCRSIKEQALHRLVAGRLIVGGPEAGEGIRSLRSHPSFELARQWPAGRSVGLFSAEGQSSLSRNTGRAHIHKAVLSARRFSRARRGCQQGSGRCCR